MARRKLNLSGKVRASTILEVVISMVIIVIVFGIAMMIYGNVLRLSLPAKKMKAASMLQERMLAIECDGESLSESTTTLGDFQVEQDIHPYGDEGRLLEVSLVAYDVNREKIAELRKVIISQ